MRKSDRLFLDRPKAEYKKRSFSYGCAKMWNSLDENVKSAMNWI